MAHPSLPALDGRDIILVIETPLVFVADVFHSRMGAGIVRIKEPQSLLLHRSGVCIAFPLDLDPIFQIDIEKNGIIVQRDGEPIHIWLWPKHLNQQCSSIGVCSAWIVSIASNADIHHIVISRLWQCHRSHGYHG